MNNLLRLGLVVLGGFALTPTIVSLAKADGADKNYWFEARLRSEHVSQDNALSDATALTLRSRLGYESDEYSGFRFLAEAENIFAAVDRYNSTTNGRTDRSVVPDPEDTEVNRAYLSYSGFAGTKLKLGRQRMIFDNSRFVGNVGWRQNEQTFDALTVESTIADSTTLKLGYIDQVNRIFGPDSPNGTTDMSSPVVNVRYTGFEGFTLTGYGYFLDFDDAPGQSQRTLGLRVQGGRDLGDNRLKYLVEFAKQDDYADGSPLIDAHYVHTALTLETGGVAFGLGYELLSGDGNSGFQTPLATAHAFNGWADLFLSTPADGLEDVYISAGGKVRGFKLKALYHWFSPDSGSGDYGRELNVIASRKLGQRFSALLKYADYEARGFGTDSTKVWLLGEFRY